MVILLHILIALSSIVESTFLLIWPSQKKLVGSYMLLAATIGSGTYLIITTPTHILTTCIEGLLYIGFVISSIVIASARLKKATLPQSEE